MCWKTLVEHGFSRHCGAHVNLTYFFSLRPIPHSHLIFVLFLMSMVFTLEGNILLKLHYTKLAHAKADLPLVSLAVLL